MRIGGGYESLWVVSGLVWGVCGLSRRRQGVAGGFGCTWNNLVMRKRKP